MTLHVPPLSRHALAALALLALALPAHAQTDRTAQLRSEIARLKKVEPSAYETQERALEHFRVDPSRIAFLRAAAAWKALVPYFEVSSGATAAQLNEATKLDEYSQERDWVTRGAQGAAGQVGAKLSWNLPRLVFNAEELDVTGLNVVQRDVMEHAIRIYYLRRRLQVQLIANPPTEHEALLEREMRIEELTSLLSGMTGGWFGEEIKRRGGGG